MAKNLVCTSPSSPPLHPPSRRCSLPQPPHILEDDHQAEIVDMVESANVVSALLRYIYPVARPPHRYKVEAAITSLRLQLPLILESNPLAFNSVSQIFASEDEANRAERELMKMSLERMFITEVGKSMDGLPAHEITRLLQARFSRVKRAKLLNDGIDGHMDDGVVYMMPGCTSCSSIWPWVTQCVELASAKLEDSASFRMIFHWSFIAECILERPNCRCGKPMKMHFYDIAGENGEYLWALS